MSFLASTATSAPGARHALTWPAWAGPAQLAPIRLHHPHHHHHSPRVYPWGRGGETRVAMEAQPARGLMHLPELLTQPYRDSESPPKDQPPTQKEPAALRCLAPNGRSPWPGCPDSATTALPYHQEKEEAHTGFPSSAVEALGPCWELMVLGMSEPLNKARNPKSMQCPGLDSSGIASTALSRRRPRKQPSPCMGMEKMDPRFKGVTLEFRIQPDSSLQIVSTYSLPGDSYSQKSSTSPTRAPEPSPGGSEALGPRSCASCRTQRTPLWRDAEDGTPLCNACGIRYKKYGTRCSSCWLVPRKSVQPKRLCGRCGVSLDPHLSQTQEA
ncbi:GATA-type zinc finger protein 1 isoform X2 [Nannospalax galili]|nr:GATA-type zinc finger protein 1 isoform X2 [Nannospalax galili]